MGKKQKIKDRKEKSAANKEAYTRMNYLYQASHRVLMENPNNLELSRFYVFTMKSIGKKLLCKMYSTVSYTLNAVRAIPLEHCTVYFMSRDPSIKRRICKYCHSVLIPGLTSTTRIRAKREKHVVIKCLDCGNLKRFNARRNFQLWSEQNNNTEALTEQSLSRKNDVQYKS